MVILTRQSMGGNEYGKPGHLYYFHFFEVLNDALEAQFFLGFICTPCQRHIAYRAMQLRFLKSGNIVNNVPKFFNLFRKWGGGGITSQICSELSACCNRPYAYDVTEGRPRMLGVKRGTVTCAIAKHAASGPNPACHTAGPARARALTERLRAPTLFQHNTCAQRDKS